MFASGVVHVLVWFSVGDPWPGPVSARKPILFGVSTGVTAMSLAWVLTKIKARGYDRFTIPVLSVSLVGEVALITLQYWRGVASHFNRSTTFDASVEWLMTALILLASAIVFNIAARSFRSSSAAADTTLAMRSGLLFLVISILAGIVISVCGYALIQAGKPPTTFGKSGVLKFPHGVAIHAIQLFPMMGWLLSMFGVQLSKRVEILKLSVASMWVFLIYSIFQTLTGRGRYEWNLVGGLLIGLSLVLATAAVAVVIKDRVMSRRQEMGD